MNTFTDGFKKTTDGVSQGVGGVSSGLGKGVQGIGNATGLSNSGDTSDQSTKDAGKDTKGVGKGVGDAAGQGATSVGNAGQNISDNVPKPDSNPTNDASGPASGIAPQKSDENRGGGGFFGGITGAVNTATSGVTTGANAIIAPTADAAKSGAALARDATGAGLSIGQKIATSGLDMGADVVSGTASLTGTALGGVVSAAAETSGAVFEPIGSGLKTIEGLDKLGQGVEAINGLSLGAVRQIGTLTTKALNMSGKTPTFFDPDADGVVGIPDTTKGLVLLGLDEKTAKYAAYALHTIFSYPTSDKWVPSLNTALPIQVSKMGGTRWGKNWGSFERLDWVDDVEIDDFFAPKTDEKQWADYWTQGRQYFGILLLIFEWGTTWPFYMPPVPVQEIPFADDIGKVVRKAILPTILSNFKKARAAGPDANKPPGKKPSEDPPADPKEA